MNRLATAVFFFLVGGMVVAAADDNPLEGKKGQVIGTLTAKDKHSVTVQAAGEETPRRYVYHFGGTKELLKTVNQTPIGSRVRLDWLYVERYRVIGLQPLKTPEPNE